MVEQGTHKPLAGGSNPPSATSSTSQPLTVLADAVDHGCRALAIADDACLLLAVSGGPDSMALLHGAAELVARGTRRWQLEVAHLDHGLRSGSGDDAAFVAAAAAELGVSCHVGSADVAALARDDGRSLEEAGRVARYAFLASVAEPDALIATGHTADDAAETVLINLLRGSGLGGTRGIPSRRGRVVRPLIGERRQALRSLLEEAGIEYRDDPSNLDPAFLRNRIRREVLPLLDAIRAGATDAIARFSRLATADDDLLESLAADELSRRRTSPSEVDWSVPPPAALGRRVLRQFIGEPAPSAERLEALRQAAEGPRGGRTIELGGGREASVRRHRIRVE